RDMMTKSVIPGENMLPETTYIKLGWGLEQTDDPEEVRRLMLTPINSETNLKEPYNGYLVYQGGAPEVENFNRQFRK
ncbi:MAG TPA: Glu-tRNA(Gln) amidotransferase GatDE subunit D, partial [Bacteroidetes bacterium]|nr:Glu-tRNA(Gln) amidotransferase GatDE subunit D [Bacteroidota bacterium]